MDIHIECGNNWGTRIDKRLDCTTMHIENIFAELAQIIRWGKDIGSEKITLTVTNFDARSD